MTEVERRDVARFLKRVERGLRGLPAAEVTDTVAEMRTHLLEEIGERGDAPSVLADFGEPESVAADIVTRRLRPEDGPPVPDASLGRRYSAWATDVVVGLGPLVLIPTLVAFPAIAIGLLNAPGTMPIWVLLAAVVVQEWFLAPGVMAELGMPRVTIPAWQWVLLAALIGWAVYYWLVLRRSRSQSVGLWMAGLRAVRVSGDLHVVRERDIIQKPRAAGHGRKRWWILLPAIPTGCLCLLLAAYYVSFVVGSFLQPWDYVPTAAIQVRMDEELQSEALGVYVGALVAGEPARAAAVADGEAAAAVDALALGLQAPGADWEWDVRSLDDGAYDGHITIGSATSGGRTESFQATVERVERRLGQGAVEVRYRVTTFALGDEGASADTE